MFRSGSLLYVCLMYASTNEHFNISVRVFIYKYVYTCFCAYKCVPQSVWVCALMNKCICLYMFKSISTTSERYEYGGMWCIIVKKNMRLVNYEHFFQAKLGVSEKL